MSKDTTWLQSPTKRKILSVGGGEVKVIRETESGQKKTDMCQEFSLVNSTIQTIWENRDKIVSAFNQNGSQLIYERLNKVM